MWRGEKPETSSTSCNEKLYKIPRRDLKFDHVKSKRRERRYYAAVCDDFFIPSSCWDKSIV